MDTHEVERIRALVADEYWQATEGAHHDLGTFSELALADLRTLLRIIDAQAAVIAAAGEVVADAQRMTLVAPMLDGKNKPDGETISIGYWFDTYGGYREFAAVVKYELGDIRKARKRADKLHDALAALKGAGDGE